jgi:hypothetical protein
MSRRSPLHLTPLAVALAATVAGRTAPAQAITEVSRTPVADAAQLTFGYLCDDRFVIRNDGTQPVALEYGIEKGNEHTKLDLNARETVELQSKSKAGLELWMNGKLVAIARKDRRSCKDVQGNAAVTITPLQVAENERGGPPARAYGAFGWYDPYFAPWYGYAYYGPFGRPYVTTIIRVPAGGARGGRRR